MKNTLVMKFGGTSVGSAKAIRQVIEIARSAKMDWQNVAIVVSAMSGVTDALLNGAATAVAGDETVAEKVADELRFKHFAALDELAPEADTPRQIVENSLKEFVTLCHAIRVLGEATPRALDAIGSLGERMSAPLVSAALQHAGIPSSPVDTREVVVTDDFYQSAAPDMAATRERAGQVIAPLFEQGEVPIITGFLGANRQGIVTTLGRGGSDFSGAIFGVVLDAEEVWIWTDVTGVMTTDPRIDKAARTIPELAFREISELAFYGAKVLHPKSIRPVVEKNITLWVKNTFEPEQPGTRIVRDEDAQLGNIQAVTAFKGQCIVTVEGRGMIGIPGIAARTFAAVARQNTSIVMISQASSEQSICFVVPCNTSQGVVSALEEEFRLELGRRDIDRIWRSSDSAIITVVGAGMRSTPGIAGKVLSALGAAKINVVAIAQGSSECSISVVVDSADTNTAVLAIHQLIVGAKAEEQNIQKEEKSSCPK